MERLGTYLPICTKGKNDMATHSRKFTLETLERRQLLSHTAGFRPGDVSVFAKPKPKTIAVNGTISGTAGNDHDNSSNFNDVTTYFDGSGSLPVLGFVQMTSAVPSSAGSTARGTMTLATSAGTLNLKVIEKRTGPLDLTVQNGTGAYAGYSGSGTLKVVITDPGYRHSFTTNNTLKLKLKT
jgi:hypothetical protein